MHQSIRNFPYHISFSCSNNLRNRWYYLFFQKEKQNWRLKLFPEFALVFPEFALVSISTLHLLPSSCTTLFSNHTSICWSCRSSVHGLRIPVPWQLAKAISNQCFGLLCSWQWCWMTVIALQASKMAPFKNRVARLHCPVVICASNHLRTWNELRMFPTVCGLGYAAHRMENYFASDCIPLGLYFNTSIAGTEC